MVPALPLELEIPNTKSCRVSRLSITPLEWRKTTMTRIKLSLRLGIVGGIIWGLLFSAYYGMLPYITISQEKRFAFAWQSATICFVTVVIVILGLPYFYKMVRKQ